MQPLLPPRRLNLPISSALDGLEVNTLLRRHLHLSGTVLRRVKWLEDGILLDGARVTTRAVVRTGQLLSVRLTPPARTSGMLPRPGPLDVVYEDRDLIVVNKAAGVPVHPGPGHYDDTLGNYLIWHYDQTGEPADFHPVHRLDRGTSGLMVLAKHPHAQELLRQQLHTGDFRRIYLAVCDRAPDPPSGVIDAPIGPREGSLIQREIRPDGQPARTHYQLRCVRQGRALVELALETGRTHQIRVHMASIGCPLIGDFLYGTEQPGLIPRPALHSWTLHLTHPITGIQLTLTAPLPDDLRALL